VRDQAENRQREFEEEQKRKGQTKAVEVMNRIAKQFGDWPAEQIVRATRDRWHNP